jgi:hypothetical protein
MTIRHELVPLFKGEYAASFSNSLNSQLTCLETNRSSLCMDACISPAICNGRIGQCECQSNELRLRRDFTEIVKETCGCPYEPLDEYDSTNRKCVGVVSSEHWFHIEHVS